MTKASKIGCTPNVSRGKIAQALVIAAIHPEIAKLGVSAMTTRRPTAAWLSSPFASDIPDDAPATQIFLADHALTFGAVLQIATVRHRDGER
jgi:hypothetical protein